MRGGWLVVALCACGGDDDGDNEPDAGAEPDGAAEVDAAALADAQVDAATPEGPRWARRFGTWRPDGLDVESPLEAAQTSDGGFLLTGRGWLARLDAAGEMAWQTHVGSSAVWLDLARPVDEGWELVGSVPEVKGSEQDLVRLLVGADGSIGEQELYGSPALTRWQGDTAALGDGATAISGLIRFEGDADLLPWLIVLDGDGTVRSDERLIGIENIQVGVIEPLADGSLLLAGGAGDPWIAKRDAGGTIVWSHRFESEDDEGVTEVAATSDGGAVLTGFRYGPEGTLESVGAWVAAIDADGALLWARSIDRPGIADFPIDVLVRDTPDEVLVSGTSGPDSFVLALDDAHALAWTRSYGTPGGPRMLGTDDGGLLLFADTSPGEDLWIARTGPDGRVDEEDCGAAPAPTFTIGDAGIAAVPIDVAVTVEPIEPHVPESSPVGGETSDLYQEILCGAGESTPWPEGALGDPCTCSPGSLCAGPEVECGFGLTCVGHYTSGGNPTAQCSMRCGSETPNCDCVLLDVGGAILGFWCL